MNGRASKCIVNFLAKPIGPTNSCYGRAQCLFWRSFVKRHKYFISINEIRLKYTEQFEYPSQKFTRYDIYFLTFRSRHSPIVWFLRKEVIYRIYLISSSSSLRILSKNNPRTIVYWLVRIVLSLSNRWRDQRCNERVRCDLYGRRPIVRGRRRASNESIF